MLQPLLFAALSLLPPQQKPEPMPPGGDVPSAAAQAPGGQGELGQQGPPPAPGDIRFWDDFGKDGEPGAFRIWFDRRGGSIFSVQLLDHYVDVAAKQKGVGNHGPGDYLLLVRMHNQGADELSLQTVETPGVGGNLFPLLDGTGLALWDREQLPDGERFSIKNGKGLTLIKTFRWLKGQRELELQLQVVADETAAAQGQLHLTMPGLALTNATEISLFGNPSVGIVVAADGERTVFPAPALGTTAQQVLAGKELSMAGSTDRFFGGFLYPRDAGAKTAVQRVSMVSLPFVPDPITNTAAGSSPRLIYDLQLTLPAAGQTTTATFGLYLGPKSYHVFEESPEHLRFLPILDHDLEPPCCFGITVPFGKQIGGLLVRLMNMFQSVVGNWGIAIMMLTILVRGLLSPLNFKMQKSMRAYGAKMAVLQPKLKALQEKYKDNKPKLQQEMVAFQRENKMLPPVGGCLPIFLTMPIYIGLFTALRTAYDLRQQAFLPVWITDLSQPDSLVDLGFWPHHLNLLPLIWMALVVRMSLKQPLPTDPQQRQTQQIMRYMPVIFGVMLYNYASGLMLYMVTSMFWSMAESALIKKKLGPIDSNAAAMAPMPIM